MWQIVNYSQLVSVAAFNSWSKHQWYLDPKTVVFVLANSDGSITDKEKSEIGTELFSFDRPTDYVFTRRNNSGLIDYIESFNEMKEPPSLS